MGTGAYRAPGSAATVFTPAAEQAHSLDVARSDAFALHVARRVVRGRERLAAWRAGLLVLAFAATACSSASSVPDAVDASDGCAAYFEPVGDDASVLFDPCSPRPVKPRDR